MIQPPVVRKVFIEPFGAYGGRDNPNCDILTVKRKTFRATQQTKCNRRID